MSMLIRNQVASMVRDRQHFQTKPLTTTTAAAAAAAAALAAAAVAVAPTNPVPHAVDEPHPATLTTIPSQQNHVANGQVAQPALASQSAAPTITNIQIQHVSKRSLFVLAIIRSGIGYWEA